jgi:hypothetical protein|tara:strand:+ start:3382 stop:3714 length:333 start_codon:yes stop_codon:yes gene_type:complete
MNKSQFITSIRNLPAVILEEIYDFAFLNNLQKDKLFKELVLGNIQGRTWAQEIDYILDNKEHFMNYAMISQKKRILAQRHDAIVFGYKSIIYMPNVENPFVIKRSFTAYE